MAAAAGGDDLVFAEQRPNAWRSCFHVSSTVPLPQNTHCAVGEAWATPLETLDFSWSMPRAVSVCVSVCNI